MHKELKRRASLLCNVIFNSQSRGRQSSTQGKVEWPHWVRSPAVTTKKKKMQDGFSEATNSSENEYGQGPFSDDEVHWYGEAHQSDAEDSKPSVEEDAVGEVETVPEHELSMFRETSTARERELDVFRFQWQSEIWRGQDRAYQMWAVGEEASPEDFYQHMDAAYREERRSQGLYDLGLPRRVSPFRPTWFCDRLSIDVGGRCRYKHEGYEAEFLRCARCGKSRSVTSDAMGENEEKEQMHKELKRRAAEDALEQGVGLPAESSDEEKVAGRVENPEYIDASINFWYGALEVDAHLAAVEVVSTNSSSEAEADGEGGDVEPLDF
jgi:hypothetical protein